MCVMTFPTGLGIPAHYTFDEFKANAEQWLGLVEWDL